MIYKILVPMLCVGMHLTKFTFPRTMWEQECMVIC